jgi:hypothetical protein
VSASAPADPVDAAPAAAPNAPAPTASASAPADPVDSAPADAPAPAAPVPNVSAPAPTARVDAARVDADPVDAPAEPAPVDAPATSDGTAVVPDGPVGDRAEVTEPAGPASGPVPAQAAAPDAANGAGSGRTARNRSNDARPNGRVANGPEIGKLDPADRGLVRRVPGAQMPAGARGARPGTSPPAPPDAAEQNAAAARSLVEEFEAGVQRALKDVPGTAETDEDGVR